MVLFQNGVLQWGWSYPALGDRDQSTWEVCTAVVCIYLLFKQRFWSRTFLFIAIKCTETYKANQIASSYPCFLWWLPMVEEYRLFSVLERIISSSDFEVKYVVLRRDLGLTFLYIEKTWIPMQWCWSNLRRRSYPIVFLIFWNRDGEVSGISSVRAHKLDCSGSDVEALD